MKCPRCKVVVQASGDSVKCSNCGLSGRVSAPAKPARDPWTITIDLRKLAPGNWSPGAKALSALLVLSLVFAAGGFSGVAFERARTEIADDFNAGADLLSGGSGQDADNLTPTDPPASAPPAPPADPPEPPADPPEPPADPEDPPEDPAEPEETVSYQVQGQGSEIKGPFEMPAGLVQAIITYHGDMAFKVKLHLEPDRPELRFDASSNGDLSGVVRYGSLETAGQYYVHTNAQDDESWEIDLVAPRGEEPEGSAFAVSGNGDGGLGPFRFTGNHTVALETAAPYTYHVAVFDADGDKLGCSFSTGPSTCTVSEETVVYFDVKIKRYEEQWRLKAEGA